MNICLRRRLYPLGLAILLGLSGCGDKPADAPPAKSGPPAVDAVRFADLAFLPEREAPATAQGKNETRLAAELAARIVAIPVDSGDKVKPGQVLVKLDARDAELALARAEAALAQANARLAQAEAQSARARSLKERNFISAEALTLRETELAAAQADVASAKAARDTARRTVEKCKLVAPFAGIVRTRSAQVGEITTPGAPLLTLADTSEMQVVAQVQARDAAGLAAAAKVGFDAAGTGHELKPLRVSPAVNREARTVEARYAFVATPPAPGTEGRLVWRDPTPHLAAEYILRRNSSYGVFVLEGNTARFLALPQAQEGRPASADFSPDARIVTRGRHALQDGMIVTLQAGGK
ncbi:efflux RND transporter periplasmic adaptor subunit [Sulfuritalea sp.]|uniref:efflux RND transporter periplasmic adaptor subunit n=1 Tax=Sulfuritalea sp. TaxID=2480090 RepID=UPI001AD531E0|nr:efflux RND transporter periplasmic adaptor subunit [Sulfuritalea sp.]MBN8473906.1 efflux RND transporter periplasmic adaptor subunit [Sulfuritalea sp.]